MSTIAPPATCRRSRAAPVGERYILGGEDMTLREILECLARLTGRPAPRIRLSHRLLAPVAAAGEAWARVAGGEPRLTRDSLRMGAQDDVFLVREG